MGKSAELLPGTLDLLILKAVSLKPLHGYGVLLRIHQISGEALDIPQGSLYPALYRLETQGLIASEWGESENNRRAKFYTLTAPGKSGCARKPTTGTGWRPRWPRPSGRRRARCDVLSRWRTIARSLFHRRGFEEDLAEEMRFHVEQYTQD